MGEDERVLCIFSDVFVMWILLCFCVSVRFQSDDIHKHVWTRILCTHMVLYRFLFEFPRILVSIRLALGACSHEAIGWGREGKGGCQNFLLMSVYVCHMLLMIFSLAML